MFDDAYFETSTIPGAVGNRDYPYISVQRSGFEGEAVGLRDNSGLALSGKGGYWWSSSQSSANGILYYLYYDKAGFYKEDYDKNYGLSVRCLKDQAP